MPTHIEIPKVTKKTTGDGSEIEISLQPYEMQDKTAP
jgi:hypothetical protein